MRNKVNNYKEKIAELYRRIHLAEKAKDDLLRYIELYNKLYDNGKLSYEEYYDRISSYLKNRSLEEWIEYYNDNVAYCKYKISELKDKLKSAERANKAIDIAANPYFIIFAILAILFGFFIFTGLPEAEITGLVIGGVEVNQSFYGLNEQIYDNVNLEIYTGDIIPNASNVTVTLVNSSEYIINISSISLEEFLLNSSWGMCGNGTTDTLQDINTSGNVWPWEGQNAYGYSFNDSDCNVNGVNKYDVNISIFYPDGLFAPAEEGIFNITLNATADDFSGSQVFYGTENITVNGSTPTVPDLNLPENNSNFSVIPELNWSNATDDEGSPITYVLQVDDSPAFTEPVSWYNGSIEETANVTQEVSITGLSDGVYYWRVLASDPVSNGSFSLETRAFTLDTTAPLLSLEFPEDNATNTTTNTIDFTYNFTEINYASTTLIITDFDNVTEYNGVSATAGQNINIYLPNAEYNWSIRVNDTAGNSNISEFRNLSVSLAQQAPTIKFVSTIGSVSITEGGTKNITFDFLIDDPDGVGDLDNASAFANFTYLDEEARNTTCTPFGNVDANTANFSCGIEIWYYDIADDWVVYITMNDSANNLAFNDTTNVTILSTTSIEINKTLISEFGSIGPSALNVNPSDDPITINNTGNFNATAITIRAIDLRGENIDTDIIFAANFSSNYQDACEGNVLSNATAVSVTGSGLARGYNPSTSLEDIFLCIEAINPDIAQQSYSTGNAGGSWTIGVS